MKFSIITPSFNQLPYLKRCVASVSDQQGVDIEHIIIDGGSADGTVEWLKESAEKLSAGRYHLTFVSEVDEGMYDALNKGFDQASGDVYAWLNCDEQYLPGALQGVARGFRGHPASDLIYGDALLVATDGHLLTYRKNPPLRRAYVLADHLYTQSASMFFRSRIFDSGLRFNAAWKAVGDCDFIERVLKAGFRSLQIREELSACSMTGDNLSHAWDGVEELKEFRRRVPRLYWASRTGLNLLRFLEKGLRGGYWHFAPFEYDLYLDGSNVRRKVAAKRVSCRFKWSAHG